MVSALRSALKTWTRRVAPSSLCTFLEMLAALPARC